MRILNKTWATTILGLVLIFQAFTVSANVIADHTLEFSTVDTLNVGQSFDVDVMLDIPSGTELTTFGFNFVNPLALVSFDGVTLSNSILQDFLNDVGGITDIFGLPVSGDDAYIATMHFTVTSSGTETISMYGELFENGGGAYFLDIMLDGSIGGSFDINVNGTPNAVPTPSLFILLLIGAFGLITTRRMNK